jgi:hypothetical protein
MLAVRLGWLKAVKLAVPNHRCVGCCLLLLLQGAAGAQGVGAGGAAAGAQQVRAGQSALLLLWSCQAVPCNAPASEAPAAVASGCAAWEPAAGVALHLGAALELPVATWLSVSLAWVFAAAGSGSGRWRMGAVSASDARQKAGGTGTGMCPPPPWCPAASLQPRCRPMSLWTLATCIRTLL